jgi:hypothetical protein
MQDRTGCPTFTREGLIPLGDRRSAQIPGAKILSLFAEPHFSADGTPRRKPASTEWEFSMDNRTIEAIARSLTQCAHVILSNRASSRTDLRFSRWFLTAENSSEPTPVASTVTATFGKRAFGRESVPREKPVGRSRFSRTRVSPRTRKPRSSEAVPAKGARMLRAEKKA